MNTEQLKTAEQILNEKRADWTYEARNDQRPVSTQLILDAMNSFASQESKREVDEFKDKLKTTLVRHWHKKTGDEIYDLINYDLPNE